MSEFPPVTNSEDAEGEESTSGQESSLTFHEDLSLGQRTERERSRERSVEHQERVGHVAKALMWMKAHWKQVAVGGVLAVMLTAGGMGLADKLKNGGTPDVGRPAEVQVIDDHETERKNYDGSFNQIGTAGMDHNRSYERQEDGSVTYNENSYSQTAFGEFAGVVKDADGNEITGAAIDNMPLDELQKQVPAEDNLDMMRETSLRQPTSIAAYANKVSPDVWRQAGLDFVADNMNDPNALADMLMEGGSHRDQVEAVWNVLDGNFWDVIDVEYQKTGGKTYYTTGIRNGNTEDARLITGQSSKERTVMVFTKDGVVVGMATPTCGYQPITETKPNMPEVPGDPLDPETPDIPDDGKGSDRYNSPYVTNDGAGEKTGENSQNANQGQQGYSQGGNNATPGGSSGKTGGTGENHGGTVVTPEQKAQNDANAAGQQKDNASNGSQENKQGFQETAPDTPLSDIAY